MMKYLRPLGVFLGGQLFLLIVFLFLPAIGTAGTGLAAATAEYDTVFWGWTWAVGAVKLWVVLFLELIVLYVTARTFLATKG